MLIESKRGKKRKISTSPSVQQDLSTIPPTSPAETTSTHGNIYDPLKSVRNLPKTVENGRPRTASTSTFVTEQADGAQETQETLYAQVLDKATNGVLPDVKEGVVHVQVGCPFPQT